MIRAHSTRREREVPGLTDLIPTREFALYFLGEPSPAADVWPLPFSSARYSRYKYGSVAAAEAFARALGTAFPKTLAERLELPLAYVRTEARAGGGPLVECSPGGGTRAVIVEDVVASGGSAATAIEALLAETGIGIAGVQSIANWNFPEMRARLAPWTVRAITSYPQVLASAQEAGLVSAADVSQLLRFYADPRRHSWTVAGGPSRRPYAARSRPFRPVRHARPRRAGQFLLPRGAIGAGRQPGALACLLPRAGTGRDAGGGT